MTVSDGRTAAWINAWQALQAAEKIAVRDRELDATAVRYLNAQARVYAMLASVPAAVGYIAGDWLREQQEERLNAAAYRAERLADRGADNDI